MTTSGGDARRSAIEDALLGRRSTRRFDPDRAVDDETIDRLLTLAASAPSADDLQPWRFIVVRSARNRRRLRACTFGRPEAADAPVVVLVLGYLNAAETDLDALLSDRLRRGLMTPEEAAEARAVVPRAARIGDRALWATRSASRALMALLIAAEGLGVASSTIEPFDESRLRAAFGIPDDHVPCGVVALGHALDSPPEPGRFAPDHLRWSEHFGQPWPS